MELRDMLWSGFAVLAVVIGFSSFWAAISKTYDVIPPAYIATIQQSAESFEQMGKNLQDTYMATDPSNSPYVSLGVVFNLLRFVLFDISKMILQDAPNALYSIFATLAEVLHVPTALVSLAVLVLVIAVILGVLGK